jgi:hypothetical protein
MTLKRRLFSGAILLTFAAQGLAIQGASAETTPAGQSQTETSWTRNIGLSIGAENYGPSLTEFDAYRPDVAKGTNNNPKDLVRSKLKFTPSYKVGASSAIILGIEGALQATKGFDFTDPYLAYRDSKAIDTAGVTTDAAVRLYGGLSPSAGPAKRIASLRLIQDTKWNIAGSRWMLELYSYYHRFFYSASASGTSMASELFLNPVLGYRTSASLQIQLQSKTWAHESLKSSFLALNADPTLLSVGVSWDVVPGLNLNPFIDMSPSQSFRPEFSTLGLFMSWKAI